jgi:hypothetical protein
VSEIESLFCSLCVKYILAAAVNFVEVWADLVQGEYKFAVSVKAAQ